MEAVSILLNRALEILAFLEVKSATVPPRLGIASDTCPGSVHHTIVEIPGGGPALFCLISESPAEPSAQRTKSSIFF